MAKFMLFIVGITAVLMFWFSHLLDVGVEDAKKGVTMRAAQVERQLGRESW